MISNIPKELEGKKLTYSTLEQSETNDNKYLYSVFEFSSDGSKRVRLTSLLDIKDHLMSFYKWCGYVEVEDGEEEPQPVSTKRLAVTSLAILESQFNYVEPSIAELAVNYSAKDFLPYQVCDALYTFGVASSLNITGWAVYIESSKIVAKKRKRSSVTQKTIIRPLVDKGSESMYFSYVKIYDAYLKKDFSKYDVESLSAYRCKKLGMIQVKNTVKAILEDKEITVTEKIKYKWEQANRFLVVEYAQSLADEMSELKNRIESSDNVDLESLVTRDGKESCMVDADKLRNFLGKKKTTTPDVTPTIESLQILDMPPLSEDEEFFLEDSVFKQEDSDLPIVDLLDLMKLADSKEHCLSVLSKKKAAFGDVRSVIQTAHRDIFSHIYISLPDVSSTSMYYYYLGILSDAITTGATVVFFLGERHYSYFVNGMREKSIEYNNNLVVYSKKYLIAEIEYRAVEFAMIFNTKKTAIDLFKDTTHLIPSDYTQKSMAYIDWVLKRTEATNDSYVLLVNPRSGCFEHTLIEQKVPFLSVCDNYGRYEESRNIISGETTTNETIDNKQNLFTWS